MTRGPAKFISRQFKPNFHIVERFGIIGNENSQEKLQKTCFILS